MTADDHDIEALPPDVLALVALERDGYGDYAGVRAAMLSRVELAVSVQGEPAGPGDGTPTPPGSAAPDGTTAFALGARGIAAVAIASLVVGAGVTMLVDREPWVDRSNSVGTTATAAASGAGKLPASPAPAPTSAPSESAAAIRVGDLPPAPSTRVPASASGRPAHANDLTLERELLDVARASLARGNTTGAIESLRRHARRWPHGQLAEEREVVWIQALVAGGQRLEAEERGARFRREYPSSALASAVDAALAGTSNDRKTP